MLVVEDDENLRESVQDWPIFENHTVEIAITGPEALEQLSISQYDLIVLDCLVPRPNIPLYMAWRKENKGKALAWFVGASTNSKWF